MTDHPVFVPTAEGGVGGVVSEPGRKARAALILLGGYGRPARSGVNSFWARTARGLAERGVVTLRIDYCREGETLPIGQGGSGLTWKRDLDLGLLRQVAAWFRERTAGLPLLLAGSCSGARLAIELAGSAPARFAGTFLVVPYLKHLATVERRDREGVAPRPKPGEGGTVDPLVVHCFRRILTHRPSWILVGELDDEDLPLLRSRLGRTPHGLRTETVPGLELHLLDQPRLQHCAGPRLIERVAESLAPART